jgi:hypothetical protein
VFLPPFLCFRECVLALLHDKCPLICVVYEYISSLSSHAGLVTTCSVQVFRLLYQIVRLWYRVWVSSIARRPSIVFGGCRPRLGPSFDAYGVRFFSLFAYVFCWFFLLFVLAHANNVWPVWYLTVWTILLC